NHHHNAGVAVRTFAQRVPGQYFVAIAVVSGRFGWRIRRSHPDESSTALKLPRTMTVAQEAEVPDAMKPVRQDVDQEAANELIGIQGHDLLAVAIAVVLPPEPDLAVVHGHQAIIGDGDAVGIPP